LSDGLRIEGSSGSSAKLWLVGRRLLPIGLVAVAAIADSVDDHGLARNALLLALPFSAVAALVGFGGFLDSRERFAGIQALCSGTIVALLVLSCAIRSNAVHGVPPLAVSSLVAVVCLFALKGALAAAPHWRRLDSLSPAKP
jgi:Na+/proline symporter